MSKASRKQQKARTREALLASAAELMGQGKTPTVIEVAQHARISRATAYRYFPNQETLLVEAPLAHRTPDPEVLFKHFEDVSVADRVAKVNAHMLDLATRNEVQFRNLLRIAMANSIADGKASGPPRSFRRLELIDKALEPERHKLGDDTYKKLSNALCVLIGLEAWTVVSDLCGLKKKEALKVLDWAVRGLVAQAYEQDRPLK